MDAVKVGYKSTEIGIIPNDWEVRRLDELGTWKGGATPSMTNVSYWHNGNIPWASSGDIKTKKLSKTANTITERAVRESSSTLLGTGAILIVTRSGILRKYLPVALNTVPIAINQDIKALIPNGRVLNEYILQVLLERGEDILSTCMKAGTTVESIEYGWLKKYLVPLPPLPEQRAIAEVLSDIDAQIDALDVLITKKRDIKQGAMQELLAGKKRLPGFSGEWEVKQLSQFLKLRYGKSQSGKQTTGGKFPIIGTGGEVGRTDEFLYVKPSIIIGRKGTIDVPQYVDTPFWAIDTTYYSEISDLVDTKFLYYVFTRFDWYSYNEASGVPSLSAKTVENINIIMPCLEEQIEIASILSDMDAEIKALETQRTKTVALKQGVMQELLTGRTRLL